MPLTTEFGLLRCLQEATSHEAAAMLLVMLGELPRTLIPAAAVVLVGAAVEAGQVGLRIFILLLKHMVMYDNICHHMPGVKLQCMLPRKHIALRISGCAGS